MNEEIGRDVIGTEILDGHPTTVSQVTVRDGEQGVVYYQWWADDVQLPLARRAKRRGLDCRLREHQTSATLLADV